MLMKGQLLSPKSLYCKDSLFAAGKVFAVGNCADDVHRLLMQVEGCAWCCGLGSRVQNSGFLGLGFDSECFELTLHVPVTTPQDPMD